MKSWVIQDGRGTRAEILPEKGATVVSLSRDGVEFLYRDSENLESRERPRCGIPFLFPIFGRLKDGKYVWDGKEYAMEIHGFGHLSRWQVAEEKEELLRLRLDAEETTLGQYPFRFRAELCFTVADGVLTVGQKYENRGDTPMPYNYGFHPYFLLEDLSHGKVEATAQVLVDYAAGGPRAFGQGTVTVAIPEGAPEGGAALAGVKAPVVLDMAPEGRRVTLEFGEDFPQTVLWTQKGKKFLCVEPINGTPDGLNTGKFFTLAPGEARETAVKIRAEVV